MPRIVLGLDFGTSSTSVSYADLDGKQIVKTAVLEHNNGQAAYKTMPSAMFYVPELQELLFGRKAINAYINREYDGRLLRNLKSVLDSVDKTTMVSENKNVSYFYFIHTFLKCVKERVIAEAGSDNIVGVVVGRPVHFFDNDEERDKLAEQNLRRIIEELGFKNIVFLEEPIAASFSLEKKIPTDTVAFVADIGGGTSDFAAIALGPSHAQKKDRRQDVFATTGIKTGGTDFDKSFSLYRFMPELGFGTEIRLANDEKTTFPRECFDMLSNAFTINNLYNNKVIENIERNALWSLARPKIRDLLHIIKTENGHVLITEVETCKKGLSYDPEWMFDRRRAFNLADGLFMKEEELEDAFSEFKSDTEQYLAERNATQVLNCIKSKLVDYKKQYVSGNQEYDILFGHNETDAIREVKKKIDAIVYKSLEIWANRISEISIHNVKNEFNNYKDDINKFNIDKIKKSLNDFKNINEFKFAFEPDDKIGYKIFNDLFKINLPENQIFEIAKDELLKHINYREKLFKKIKEEFSYSTMQRLESETMYECSVTGSPLYQTKLQQRVFEEYKRQKGVDEFKKQQKIVEKACDVNISSFITSIKKRIFVDCENLDNANVLLREIKDLIHIIELSMFEFPDLDMLKTYAKEIGTIYKDAKISRKDLEYSIDEYMPKLKKSINECIKKSGKDKSEFKYLIMTGGSSRVPKVREAIKECFDKDIKVVCEDLSDQKDKSHNVIENIDTPDDISVGLCWYAINMFK